MNKQEELREQKSQGNIVLLLPNRRAFGNHRTASFTKPAAGLDIATKHKVPPLSRIELGVQPVASHFSGAHTLTNIVLVSFYVATLSV